MKIANATMISEIAAAGPNLDFGMPGSPPFGPLRLGTGGVINLQVPAMPPVGPLGFEIGTGGSPTVEYVTSRGEKGYPFLLFNFSKRSIRIGERTPAENIKRIIAVLGPTVTDLAETLRVSRQTIYNWHDGSSAAEENASRLSDLARAADAFALEGLMATSRILRRPIKNGKNFFQLVRGGASPENLALALIEIVRTESRQRDSLKKRLVGRKRPSRESLREIGAPMLDGEE